MNSLRHPNIVGFFGACTRKPEELGIVLEYCKNGSLWNYIHNGLLDSNLLLKLKIARGIVRAMIYLHSFKPPILHRDLKSMNILLDSCYKPKLADFGESRLISKKMTSCIGTWQWMAPEVISGQYYTEKADVYSFSIVLWELLHGKAPYSGIPGLKVGEEVSLNKLRPELASDCLPSLSSLLRICWSQVPTERPSFEEIYIELKKISQFIKNKK